MKLAKSIQQLKFRLDLRKTLVKEPYDLVKITYEESKKELERRNSTRNCKKNN